MSASPATTAAKRRQRELFLAALALADPAARLAYLDEACSGDAVLRQAIADLLEEQGRLEGFLDAPAASVTSGELSARDSVHPRPGPDLGLNGVRIDHYRILEKLGEGGCGTVYLAEQDEPIRRRVALKVIKPGMDTQAVIARFEGERQALALMDHPGIARVLDAGTTDYGRPFFVMELVRGPRITAFCDENHLGLRQRLELFIKVCNAIQHAHQKGVIHRDIKPSNLLVTRHDGEAVPKVIDFGIAKAIEQRLTENTQVTSLAQFLGTPAYVSPEQAEMSGLDLDTRSDLYSLGVLLYELLTGAPPFDGQELLNSGFDAMRRTIRETDPPPPSTRLESHAPETLESIAAARGTDSARWIRTVRGDLDWIVMKAIAKDRQLRYETASALAADVLRHLKGEEVTARPPTRRYRLGKFVHRNRGLVGAAAAVLTILLVATGTTTWQAVRATRAEHEQTRLRGVAEDARREEARQRQVAEAERATALHRAYNSDMNLVQQALQANNYGRAVDLLDRHRRRPPPDQRPGSITDPDPRHWEWRYFWSQSRSEALFALPRQSRTLNSLALSRDGTTLVSLDRSGNAVVWDAARRKSLAGWRSNGRAGAVAASPADDRLAFATGTAPRRATIQVWSPDRGAVTTDLELGSGILALTFTPDGATLLILGDDGMLRSWDFTTRPPTSVPLPEESAQQFFAFATAAFSPDARLLALSSGGRVQILDLESRRVRCRIDAFSQHIASLAFSADSKTLAVGPSFFDVDTNIRLFDASTGVAAGVLTGHVSWIPSLVFSPDGTRLYSAGADQTIRIWELPSHRELAVLRGHLSEVNCLALSADGATLFSGCKDGTLFAWDARRTGRMPSYRLLPGRASGAEFSRDGRTLYTYGGGEGVRTWDTATLQGRERLEALGRDVDRLVASGDETRVYAGARGRILVLDLAGNRLVETPFSTASSRRPAFPIGLLDHDRFLLTEESGGSVRSWDTRTWESTEWTSIPSPRRPAFERSVLSAAARLLAVPGPDNALTVFDLATRQSRATFSAEFRGGAGLDFSPDGSILAAASREGVVHLYDTASGEPLDSLRGHLLGVHDVAFSPDGQRLASASAKDEAVKIWDVETRHEVASLAGAGSLFNRVMFSPDGTLLAAINSSGTVHVWRAPALEEIDRLAESASSAGLGVRNVGPGASPGRSLGTSPP